MWDCGRTGWLAMCACLHVYMCTGLSFLILMGKNSKFFPLAKGVRILLTSYPFGEEVTKRSAEVWVSFTDTAASCFNWKNKINCPVTFPYKQHLLLELCNSFHPCKCACSVQKQNKKCNKNADYFQIQVRKKQVRNSSRITICSTIFQVFSILEKVCILSISFFFCPHYLHFQVT